MKLMAVRCQGVSELGAGPSVSIVLYVCFREKMPTAAGMNGGRLITWGIGTKKGIGETLTDYFECIDSKLL